MANNPYVNKVVYGNQTIMDISDTDANESDVVRGKTFYKGSGARSTGSAVIPDISNCYQTTDTAETDIDDADYFPFYDSSATAKRKSLWSNIKSVLKTYFDGIYHPLTTVDASPTNSSSNLVTSNGVYNDDSHFIARRNLGVLTAGSVVRIPESGTNSLIGTSSTDKVIPLVDIPWYDSNGNAVYRPPKYSNLDVQSGYVNITVAEYIYTYCMGVEVRKFWG